MSLPDLTDAKLNRIAKWCEDALPSLAEPIAALVAEVRRGREREKIWATYFGEMAKYVISDNFAHNVVCNRDMAFAALSPERTAPDGKPEPESGE